MERLCTSRARRPAHSDEGEDGSATLRYDIACGPQQLAKYLADMRMLVLNLEQADGEGEAGERPCYPALDLLYPYPSPYPYPYPYLTLTRRTHARLRVHPPEPRALRRALRHARHRVRWRRRGGGGG